MEKSKKLTLGLSIGWLAALVLAGVPAMAYYFSLFRKGSIEANMDFAAVYLAVTMVVFLPTLFVIHHLSGKAGPKAIRIISKIAAIFLSVWCLIVLIAVILFKTVGF